MISNGRRIETGTEARGPEPPCEVDILLVHEEELIEHLTPYGHLFDCRATI